MQASINGVDDVVDDALAGFLAAHGDLVARTSNPRVLTSTAGAGGRVAVVSGGGSGHEPAFAGYVWPGMLDAVAIGEVFTSPSMKVFLDAFRAADSGHGVVCVYGNYAGDNLNVRMAVRRAADEGIEVVAVSVNDDVLSAPAAEADQRRGLSGEVLTWKAAAAVLRRVAPSGPCPQPRRGPPSRRAASGSASAAR